MENESRKQEAGQLLGCAQSILLVLASGPHTVSVTSIQLQGLKVNLDIRVLGLAIPNQSILRLWHFFKTLCLVSRLLPDY